MIESVKLYSSSSSRLGSSNKYTLLGIDSGVAVFDFYFLFIYLIFFFIQVCMDVLERVACLYHSTENFVFEAEVAHFHSRKGKLASSAQQKIQIRELNCVFCLQISEFLVNCCSVLCEYEHELLGEWTLYPLPPF